eukprot:1911238-Prymnesium_polylepis.1
MRCATIRRKGNVARPTINHVSGHAAKRVPGARVEVCAAPSSCVAALGSRWTRMAVYERPPSTSRRRSVSLRSPAGRVAGVVCLRSPTGRVAGVVLSLIHISEPTRRS